jgi:coenzyme F420-0:L-glutamate ligase/coenzyme F420-1:gamma-L-glutamate ligase
VLEATDTAVADSIAAAADLVAGQAAEGRPITLVRGARFQPEASSATALLRDPDDDLYA